MSTTRKKEIIDLLASLEELLEEAESEASEHESAMVRAKMDCEELNGKIWVLKEELMNLPGVADEA